MERLSASLQEVAELRDTLADLQAQAVTRTEQADSVNPKVTPSPYVNILGLQRTFRDSTRQGLLLASIVIGALALIALGFLVVAFVSGSGLAQLVTRDYPGASDSFTRFTTTYKTVP